MMKFSGKLSPIAGCTDKASFSRRRERFCILDPLSLYKSIDFICCYIFQLFHFAAGPSNLDRIHFVGGSQPEMQAKIILREITPAAVDFVKLRHPSGVNRHPRSDRCSITPRTLQLEQNAVIGILICVQ